MKKKDKSPTGQQIKDLRKRHEISQSELAQSLYGNYSAEYIGHWENGRRNCPPLAWWAMVLTWDHRDLWQEEHTFNEETGKYESIDCV